jgi:hypothetical protein
MTAQIIQFRPKPKPRRKRSDVEIRSFLRRVYRDVSLPFELRAKAAIMAPYFGDYPYREAKCI